MVALLRRILLGLKKPCCRSKGKLPCIGGGIFMCTEVDAMVTVSFENRIFEGYLHNVSISGALLETNCGLRVGAELGLELANIPGFLKARVTRLSANGAGVQFANPNVGVMIAGWSRGTTAASVMSASRSSRG